MFSPSRGDSFPVSTTSNRFFLLDSFNQNITRPLVHGCWVRLWPDQLILKCWKCLHHKTLLVAWWYRGQSLCLTELKTWFLPWPWVLSMWIVHVFLVTLGFSPGHSTFLPNPKKYYILGGVEKKVKWISYGVISMEARPSAQLINADCDTYLCSSYLSTFLYFLIHTCPDSYEKLHLYPLYHLLWQLVSYSPYTPCEKLTHHISFKFLPLT